MFPFRNFFITALATSVLVASMVPPVHCAPWWPMHFVLDELPSSSISSLGAEPTALPSSVSLPIISSPPFATAAVESPVSSQDAEAGLVSVLLNSTSSANPSADVTANAVATQSNAASQSYGLAGRSIVLCSTVAVFFMF